MVKIVKYVDFIRDDECKNIFLNSPSINKIKQLPIYENRSENSESHEDSESKDLDSLLKDLDSLLKELNSRLKDLDSEFKDLTLKSSDYEYYSDESYSES